MHVYVIFAHPSKRSFSRSVLDAFTKGLKEAGHSYEIADLYEMGFQSEMDEAQYFRETSGSPDLPVPSDVQTEQAILIDTVQQWSVEPLACPLLPSSARAL